MQAPGEHVRQFLPLPRSAVMMVPGVGCGDLYPLCFHSSGRYHTERAWSNLPKLCTTLRMEGLGARYGNHVWMDGKLADCLEHC
jgi:hypothetical protein